MAEIRPQPGPQEAFLSSPADIAIYGGAAGGGKSYALLLEPLRHLSNAQFGAVVFRRTLADVKKQGSLLDTSMQLYGAIGGKIRLDNLAWTFPGGAKVTFGHLEHETTVLDWQGAQIPLICYDELTHFSRSQFFYLLSRNRSTCGVRPYIRATTNPDAESWVSEFIAWWIDQDTGQAIAERAGKLRWFARVSDQLVWADTATEIENKHPGSAPKSLTFIPARLEDNAILMSADPGYRANLLSMQLVERERLLGGNWKIKPAAGMFFQRHWCEFVQAIPAGTKFVRGWDLAGTPKTEMNDPDWTCGTKIGLMPDGRFIVADHVALQDGPFGVERAILNTASSEPDTEIALPQDPAQAGKSQAQQLIAKLSKYTVRARPITGKKIERFRGFSSQAEAGNVLILEGAWNERWCSQLEAFGPDAKHDDDADATAEAYNALVGTSNTGMIEFYGRMALQAPKAAPAPRIGPAEVVDGLVAMLAPAGVSTAYGMSGRCYSVVGGMIHADPEDVGPFRAAGFREMADATA